MLGGRGTHVSVAKLLPRAIEKRGNDCHKTSQPVTAGGLCSRGSGLPGEAALEDGTSSDSRFLAQGLRDIETATAWSKVAAENEAESS